MFTRYDIKRKGIICIIRCADQVYPARSQNKNVFFASLNVLHNFTQNNVKRISIICIIKCAAEDYPARSQKKKYHLHNLMWQPKCKSTLRCF